MFGCQPITQRDSLDKVAHNVNGAIGATDFMGSYSLGGNVGDSAFYVTPDEFRMLRGYPIAADIGAKN